MSANPTSLQTSTIQQACKQLRLPRIGSQFTCLAEQTEREHQSYLGYLDALLSIELKERERHTVARRLKEAHLPRLKTLEEFDFHQAPQISPSRIAALADGGYLERAEPVVFIGDSGIGRTHLLSGLCVPACRQKRRVCFTTAAGLVKELVEAKQQLQLRRVLARWTRYELIAIDEFGAVPVYMGSCRAPPHPAATDRMWRIPSSVSSGAACWTATIRTSSRSN